MWVGCRPLLLLIVLGIAVGTAGIANHELWTADEPRVAGVGREMWTSGSWAVPRLSGLPFLEKPPLYWWSQIALFEAFGRADAGTARAASGLFGSLTLLLTYALARCFFSRKQSLLGSLVLLSTYLFVMRSHWIVVDPALLLGITGALWCAAQVDLGAGPARGAWLAGMYTFLGIGFFAKGLVGIALPGLGLLVYLAAGRRLREFVGWHLLWGGAALLVAIALWLWRVWLSDGAEGLHTFLVHNQLGRLLPGRVEYTGGHERPIYYYLLLAPLDLLPWSPCIALAALAAHREAPQLPGPARAGIRFVFCVAGTAFVALSLAGTKRGLYLLPIAPLVALLVGWWMGAELQQPRWERVVERGWRAALWALVIALPTVAAVLERDYLARSALGVVTLGLLAWWLHPIPAGARSLAWLRVLIVLCVAWVLALASAPPAYDPHKSLRPLAVAIDRLVPDGATLYAFAPSETTRGVIAFYTDHKPTLVPDTEAVRALAQARRESWMVVEGREGGSGAYGRLLEAGIPLIVHDTIATRSGRELYLVTVEPWEGFDDVR